MDQTSLLEACEAGDIATVETMLGNGANPNETDETLGSPLYQAIKTGNPELLALLIDNDADVNMQIFNHHMSPLIASIVHEFKNGFEQLITNDEVDVNYQNSKGESAIYFALKKNNIPFIRRLLGHPEINLKLMSTSGYSILMQAVADQNVKAVILLLNEMSDEEVLLENSSHLNALVVARKGKSKKILTWIEDRFLPEFQTQVGRILAKYKLRDHALRFFDLKLRDLNSEQVQNLLNRKGITIMQLKLDKSPETTEKIIEALKQGIMEQQMENKQPVQYPVAQQDLGYEIVQEVVHAQVVIDFPNAPGAMPQSYPEEDNIPVAKPL